MMAAKDKPSAYVSSDQQKQLFAEQVAKIPLLIGLSPETLDKVIGFMKLRTAEKGSSILHKGGAGENLFFLLSGRLQVLDTSEDGREIGLTFLKTGDYFGELSVIDGLPRSASVVATEHASYGVLTRAQALDLIYKNPVVAARVFKKLASDIRRAAPYRSILGIPGAFQRVYALLNYLAQTYPTGLVVIEHMPTHHEISIMVNTSRETVSRALGVIMQSQVVQKDMKRLIVRQPEALRLASLNENPLI
jgi:CRP-like cAMP-binding protein